jgi:hypothetical protein
MRNKSEDYRLNAVNCLTVAEQTADPAARAMLIAIARSWYALGDQAERNSMLDLVYETPQPTEQQQQPVVQQQQQIQPGKDEPED